MFIFSRMKENKKLTNVFTWNISELTALKLVMSWQKYESSQILFQALWHLRINSQMNLFSLPGDSFNDVVNIGQVEMLLACILNWFIVNTNGGNLIRTCYSETRCDCLIIKLVIVYRWYENLPFEWNSFLFHFFHKLITFHFSPAEKKGAYLPLYVFEKTRVPWYKLCEENKSIKLPLLVLKK